MAVQVEKRYDGSGVEHYQETRIYAVRQDGSSVWVSRRPAPNGELRTIGDIIDIKSGRVVSVDGFTQSTVTRSLSTGELASSQKIDHHCESVGGEHSILLGRGVVAVTTNRPMQGRASQTVEWQAPSLDCFALSSTSTLSIPADKVIAKTTVETQFLIPGEPPNDLFTIPSAYVERSPSQVGDEFARRFGSRPFSASLEQRAEERYQAHHR